jgi:hypothetical protein
MASSKAKSKGRSPKQSAKKGSAKVTKQSAKKASAKKASSLDLTRKIKAVAGQDEHFYKTFPRYAAYCLLVKSPKRTMTVGTFLKKIEALPKVANRKQAMGIVQKLVDKKRHVGSVCASFV